MKRILGLDLGTNSIGWALIEQGFENKQGEILGMGSRIIPMSQDIKDEFGKGNSISQTADRTNFRGVRRLRERYLLRRARLHRVLRVLGFLPDHYADEIDFDTRLGQFLEDKEPKLAWKKNAEGKFEFLFQNSFNEMIAEFKANGQDENVPYDWTIYYLRKKALSQKIEREEVAWIILNFNQKRGYYQLRGEDEEENPNKLVEFHSLKVVDVIADETLNSKGETWYTLQLENGWLYRRASKIPLYDWKEKVRDFIVTTDLNDDGSVKTDKEGAEKRSFRAPGENDWALIKKKTEQEIDLSGKTVGAYIYDSLLQNTEQKIKGKLVRTIERKFYREELKAILETQMVLQPDFFTDNLYIDCVRELYRKNEAHQFQLSKKGFVHLFVDDTIFYQRPLRSQKSSIGNCTLEYRTFKTTDESGKMIAKTQYLKTIPKSHPLYQEFRLWQWLYNLKIYTKEDDKDVTGQFVHSIRQYEDLFDFLDHRKEITQDILIKYLLEKAGLNGKALALEARNYRWNYVEDKVYPCNETKALIQTKLKRVESSSEGFLTPDILHGLWHIIYSVTDKADFEKALASFARKHDLDVDSFVGNFRRFPPFPSEYGSFSEKAIKKLLPLMRLGKYWRWRDIDDNTRNRIGKIVSGEVDEEIKHRVRKKALHLGNEEDFQGLQLWLAQYVVYDRHSEVDIAGKWNSVADLEKYLEDFRQHSLRNPIVEQVVTETLRVVRDIWATYGGGSKDFFSEIHIELGREMKNTADERKRITNQVTENENTNLRIKALLAEILNDNNVQNVRPFSPMQQELLKVYEEYAINNEERYNPVTKSFEYEPVSDEILKISKAAQPSRTELQRYKLWMEQRYRSPYTGQMIPLNRLFTSEYEIEHIIPQSRFFDDSFSNKVICESAVNKLKDKQLGLEFIKAHHGAVVEIGFGKTVSVFDEESYLEFVKLHYAKNRSKRNKLLLDEIPDKMIERQMNDTRYISKFISNVLSNIVRADSNDDGVNSKNLLPGNGRITSTLKQDWGLNDVWNDLILPRFERMNLITNSNVFTAWNENHQKFLPTVPLEYAKGFSKKRIDHRHHAMDALVIACATRDHINLLNNQHAKSPKRFDLNRKLRKFERVVYKNPETGERIEKEVPTYFLKPWDNFTVDARDSLEKIVVSFKQNLRVINKTTNKHEKFVEKNGKNVKELVSQTKGESWAIRKSMHTPMPYGKKVYEFDILKIADNVGKREFILDDEVKMKVEEAYQNNKCKVTDTQKYLKKNPIRHNNGNDIIVTAFKVKTEKFRKRQPLSELSNRGQGGIKTVEDAIKFIDKVVDFKLREDFLNHLKKNDNDLEKSFSAEGLERFNAKRKIPVYKLPVAESGSGRFAVGNKIGTKHKWVEADKGTNLFLAIYQNQDGDRSYKTIPLNIVIERQKQGLSSVPDKNEKDDNLLFHLSPHDLVYILTEEEQESSAIIDFSNLTKEQVKRIYKMVSTTQDKLECVPVHYASPIRANEMGSNNKSQNSLDNIQIKSVCIKLKVDRLGNISKA